VILTSFNLSKLIVNRVAVVVYSFILLLNMYTMHEKYWRDEAICENEMLNILGQSDDHNSAPERQRITRQRYSMLQIRENKFGREGSGEFWNCPGFAN